MLKFIKHNMETIIGIDTYPIIALLIFFIFFVVLGIWVFTYNKETISEISRLPLEEDEQENEQNQINE